MFSESTHCLIPPDTQVEGEKYKPHLESLGNFHFLWSAPPYPLSAVDKSNQWPENTPGQLQWARVERKEGVKHCALENELLSL